MPKIREMVDQRNFLFKMKCELVRIKKIMVTLMRLLREMKMMKMMKTKTKMKNSIKKRKENRISQFITSS